MQPSTNSTRVCVGKSLAVATPGRSSNSAMQSPRSMPRCYAGGRRPTKPARMCLEDLGELEVGAERRQWQHALGYLVALRVLAAARRAMAPHAIVLQVENPVFRNAVRGVEGRALTKVVPQRRVADFDEQQNIARVWMFTISAFLRLDDGEVGLRLRAQRQPHGQLASDLCRIADRPDQSRVEQSNCRSLTIPDGRHVDDLSLDQLRAIVGMQHADLGHTVVVMDRESMRARPAFRLGA